MSATLQLIHRVRRRWRLQRAIDGALLGVGGVTCIALIGWAFKPLTLSQLIASLALAVVISVLLGFLRRVSAVEVAKHMDADLQTNDLLSTALQADSNDPFARSLQAQADAFAARHSAAEVHIAHVSAALRGGLALLPCIALNIAWLTQTGIQAASQSGSPRTADVIAMGTDSAPAQRRSSANSDRPTHRDAIEASESDFASGSATARATPNQRSRDAAGAAAAQTNDGVANRLSPRIGSDAKRGDGQSPDAGSAANLLAPDPARSAAALKNEPIASPSANGSVSAPPPAEYRDLIRAYFSSPSH